MTYMVSYYSLYKMYPSNFKTVKLKMFRSKKKSLLVILSITKFWVYYRQIRERSLSNTSSFSLWFFIIQWEMFSCYLGQSDITETINFKGVELKGKCCSKIKHNQTSSKITTK